MTLQDQAAALLRTVDEQQDEQRTGRLSPDDRGMIIRLAAKGNLSQEEIAKAVGCSQASVSRTLAMLDTRKEARTILESGALRMATNVVENGDPALHLKALGKLDVVREDREGSGSSIGPIVVIGVPDTFVAFEPGDIITLGSAPRFGNETPSLSVRRKLHGGCYSSMSLPATADLGSLPDGVTIDEQARPFVEQLFGGVSNARVARMGPEVLIGMAPPGTPHNPIPVGRGSTDAA